MDDAADDAHSHRSAPRAAPGAIAAMAAAVAADPAAGRLLESLELPALALAPSRQVVACNRLLLESLGLTPAQALGHRPGELLRCIHAGAASEGCGSAEACRGCGALAAIAGCRRAGASRGGTCRLEVAVLGRRRRITVEVAATPMPSAGLSLTLFTLRLSGGDPRA